MGLHLSQLSCQFDSTPKQKRFALDGLGVFNSTCSELPQQRDSYTSHIVSQSQKYKQIQQNMELLQQYNQELKRLTLLTNLTISKPKADLIVKRNSELRLQLRQVELHGELRNRREVCLKENDQLMLKFKKAFLF